MKGVILCRSRYGATRQYAGWLSTELGLPVQSPEDLTKEELSLLDYIVVGSSVYIGKLLIGKWLRKNSALLRDKKLFLFIVCGTPDSEPEQQRTIIKKNVPASLQGPAGIFFLPGRLIKQKLSRKDAMLLRLGAWLEKNPIKKKAMQSDTDEVKMENLSKILESVRRFTSGSPAASSKEYTEADRRQTN
jgi:menaquinone-dependent protoporphyrinogen IX oxidase